MYEESKRYKRELRQVKVLGNSNNRTIEFKDKDGTILTWVTTDYNKCSQNMKRQDTYSFTVEFVTVNNIFIRKVKLTRV